MFKRFEKALLSKFPFTFTKCVLIEDIPSPFTKIDTDLVRVNSLESALEYINKERPNYFKRFRIIIHGHKPDDNYIAIPPYCTLSEVPKAEGLYQISRRYWLIIEQNLFPNHYALFSP